MAKTYIITVNGKQYKKTIEDKNLEKYSEYSPVLYSEPEEDSSETSKTPTAPTIPTTITNPIESTPAGKSTNLVTDATEGSTILASDTESTSDDSSLESQLTKENLSNEDITKKYNTILQDLESQIETRKNEEFAPSEYLKSIDPASKEYESQIERIDWQMNVLNHGDYKTQEEYDDYVKKYNTLNEQRKNIADNFNTDVEVYNRVLDDEFNKYKLESENLVDTYNSTINDYYQERFGVDAPTEPAYYAIGNKFEDSLLAGGKEDFFYEETSREEMIEMLNDPSFIKQVKDGERGIVMENDPEINEYMRNVFNLDKLKKYETHYDETHEGKKETRFSDYTIYGKPIKIEVQDIDEFQKDFPDAKPVTLSDRIRKIKNDKTLSDKERIDLIEEAYTAPKQLGEMKDWKERYLHVKNNPELYHDEVGLAEKIVSWYPDWMSIWGAGLAAQSTELFVEGPIKALESEKLAKGIMEGKTREEMMASGELTDLRAFDIVQKELHKFATRHYDEEGNEMNIVDLIERGEYSKAGGLAGEQAFSSVYSIILSGANPIVGAVALGTGVYGSEYTEAVTERFKPEEIDKETLNDIRLNSAIHAGGEFLGEYLGGVLFRQAAGLRKSGATEGVIKEFSRGFIQKGVRGTIGGGVSEFAAESLTSVVQQAADKLVYADEITFRNGIRETVNAGLIGMAMGGPVAGVTRASNKIDRETAQYILAGHKWRSEVNDLNSKLVQAMEDLENAPDKLKSLYQKRVDNYKKQIDQKKKLLNSIYEGKSQKELLERARTLDERNKLIDDAFNQNKSEQTQKEARDRIKQLNEKMERETDGFINAEFEQVVGDFLKGREILDKRGATWGFGSDLKVKRLKTQKQIDDAIKKIKDEQGVDISGAEGIFIDGKNKVIYINEPRAAEVGALNVYAHELLHYVMSKNFKTDNENMKPLVDALKEYLIKSGNEKALLRIEQRMLDNGYMDENGELLEGKLEEYFEMLSDLMDKKEVKLDKNKTGSLIKPFKDFLVGLGFKTVNLKDGEAIFDFIQTFSKNINRSGLLGEITKRGITRVKLETDIKGVKKADIEAKAKPIVKEARSSEDIKKDNKDIYNQIMQNAEDFNMSPKKAAETYLDELIENNLGLAESEANKAYNKAPKELELKKRIPLDMFRSAFREELTTIAKTWDPAKNDSFGIYAANLLNKRYGQILNAQIDKLEQEVGTTGLFVQTEEGTQERKIAAEKDTRREKFEEEDLSPSAQLAKKRRDRKQSNKDIKGELIENRLEFKKDIKDKLKKVQTSTNYDIKDKSYKDVKKDINKIAKPVNTRKQIKETETSSLYPYMEVIAEHFGVKPTSIIAAAQNLSKQESANARLKIAEGMKKLGPKNYLKSMLGPFNFAADAKSKEKGVAIGLSPTILKAFYIKGKRGDAKLNITGWAFNENITDAEILAAVGLNEDFTLKEQKRAGTFDGVVKGIITQAAVVAANQGVRLQAIENIKEAHDVGTAEAIEDIQADLNKISAGKPSIMFSKTSSITQDIINNTMVDFLDNTTVDLSNTVKVKNAYKKFLEDNYPEQADILTKEQYSYIAKKITSSVKEYIKLQNKYKIAFKNKKVSDVILVDNQILPYTKKDFILTSLSPEAFLDKKVFKLLSPLFKDDVSSTSLMTSKQRANAGRQMVREVIEEMLEEGITPKEILSYIINYGEGMYATSYKILDGRFIDDGKGGLINDPKWEDWINNTGESITLGSITYKIGDKVPGNKWRTYSASSKAVKAGLAKKGDLIIENNKRVPQTNRGQVFSSLQDLINFISSIEKLDIVKNGKVLTRSEIVDKYKIDTTKFKEESDAALDDQDFKGREKQGNENANFVERLSKLYIKKIKDENDSLQYEDLYVLSRMFGSNMKSPMKRAANLRYIAEGAHKVPKKKRGQDLQYEHMEPTQYKIIEMFNELINNGKLREGFWDTYNVAIIPKKMDTVLIKNGLQNLMTFDHKPGKPPWLRYYNVRTFGNKGMVAIKDIKTGDVIGKGFVKANNMVLKGDLSKQDLQEIAKIRRIQKHQIKFSKTGGGRGASIFDFDDTLARTKSGVRGTVPNQDNKPKPKRKVIFLAGGAGSGKSNVVKKLGLEKQGFKIVNQDISLEWLKKNHGLPTDMRDLNKEQRSILGKLGHQARGIAKRKMIKFQGQGDGIIVDGTGASLKQMKKLVDEFEAKGYDVSMIFVGTSLDVALERNRARKERSLLDIIVRKNHEAVMGNKEAFKEMFGDTFMEVNTDNIGLDSPMPDKLIKQVNKFTTSYEKFRLDAMEFAEQGASILAAGGKFDFSEFEKVNEGEPGPFLQKAIERAKKFGTDDIFVLTARPAESAKHIQEFLRSQGLDLPIGNIVGLGDSTGKAKANWVLGKLEEGYNDIYFVDDAFENVKAVRDALNKADVKSDVVQAKIKFSKTGSNDFNTMLDRNKGVSRDKIFSDAEVKAMRKRGIGKWDYFIPPSAEDFKGLIYYFLGKGKQGDADLAWFKKHLLLPFARGIRAWNTYKQKMSDEYSELKKKFPKVRKLLRNKVPGTNLTVDHAVRVYLWHNNGMEIPGISAKEIDTLIDYIENNDELLGFANALSIITRLPQGYTTPGVNWALGNIATDLRNIVTEIGRKEFLSEWIDNKNIIFTKENLNKIEAVYGVWFREALENILHRMETGTNRTVGQDRIVNSFLDWISGAVGAIMFVNMRSALLQGISLVNFINWSDNNIFKAAAAFANQPQFWKDFIYIMNSPMLKQRRAGLQIDIQYNELTKAFAERGGSAQGVLNYLLELGFTPTRIMDSFAIAFGGSSFYRNRVKAYIKQGMTEKQAKEKAWLDFQEIAEETQQSSREDLISQQQASVLGRIILPFQNVTMQMTRLMKKGLSDLKHGRGDFKTNVSKVIYYGAIQNIIFGALQSALAFIMWGDDEEEIKKKEIRVLNGALDTILRGTGIWGAVASTIKNTLIQYNKQRNKPYGQTDWSAVTQEIINISPPLGSKLRLIRNAIKTTEYNQGVGEKLKYRIENPTYHSIAAVIEASTNLPVARTLNKANNLEEAITGNHDLWQRAAMLGGWSKWDVGVKDEELEAAKQEVKAERKAVKDAKRKEKREQEKIEKQKEKAAKEKAEKERKEKEGIKTVRCSGTRSNGERCKLTTETAAKTWKCMHHMEFKDGMDRDGDGVKEYRCTAIKLNGKRCNNKTENKNKKCYAHQ